MGKRTINSFAVPCNMEEDDEEDFYENCFIDEMSKMKNKPRPYESFNCAQTLEDSQNNILSFLKDDYFKNQQRKNSLKCEGVQSGVPVFFDEESDIDFSSTISSAGSFLRTSSKS